MDSCGTGAGAGQQPGAGDLGYPQLLLRINLQLRRLADGSGKVAERLFRDMLYVLAQLDCDSAFSSACNRAST